MPNRILRPGILTSERVNAEKLPDPRRLSELEILSLREILPKVKVGHWLQSYKWRLTLRLRRLRMEAAGAIPKSLLRKLISSAPSHCPVCSVEMRPWVTGAFPTVDHIHSIARGGTNVEANLRVICNRCNSSKGSR